MIKVEDLTSFKLTFLQKKKLRMGSLNCYNYHNDLNKQLPLWYELWFIVEDHNVTCRSLNSTVIWWVAVSLTIMPHINNIISDLVYVEYYVLSNQH